MILRSSKPLALPVFAIYVFRQPSAMDVNFRQDLQSV